MSELIAKRYIKALKYDTEDESLQTMSDIFWAISLSFKDKKLKNIMKNPAISIDDKTNIILDAVKSAKSEKVNNFIKLLGENNRLNIIPSIAVQMKKDIAVTSKIYTGTVYSNNDIDSKIIENLGVGLGKKFDSKITLNFVKNEFDGIKVDVEDLGVEINFSKSRINNQIIEHIVKAI